MADALRAGAVFRHLPRRKLRRAEGARRLVRVRRRIEGMASGRYFPCLPREAFPEGQRSCACHANSATARNHRARSEAICVRFRTEHGGHLPSENPRAARTKDHAQVRRDAQCRRHRLPREFASGPGDRHLRVPRWGNGGVDAALHFSWLSLCRGHRIGQKAVIRSSHRAGFAHRHAADRKVPLLESAAQPLGPQHQLGVARKFPRCPDRLPATRRASRLDRRCAGLHWNGGVPLRRARIFPQMVARLARRPAGGRRVSRHRARRAGQIRSAAIRQRGVGRCGGDLSLGNIPSLRRQGDPCGELRRNEALDRIPKANIEESGSPAHRLW